MTKDEQANACEDAVADLRRALQHVQRASRRLSAIGYRGEAVRDCVPVLNEAASFYDKLAKDLRSKA